MGAIEPAIVAEWTAAVGREMHETAVLHPEALLRFARAVGLDDAATGHPLAHWSWFLPSPTDGEIGADGHPRRGGFLPAVTLPRRMFAASAMTFTAPLVPSESATLVSTVSNVAHKEGRSGALVFVDVTRSYRQDRAERVREVQSYVYRDAGAPAALPVAASAAPDGERWEPNAVNLFRFSAATANAHRIHYDLPYATEVEGYPALVIHGPLTAARLATLAAHDGTLSGFAFRAQAPAFLGQPLYLQRVNAGAYQAVRVDGTVAMTAEATFA